MTCGNMNTFLHDSTAYVSDKNSKITLDDHTMFRYRSARNYTTRSVAPATKGGSAAHLPSVFPVLYYMNELRNSQRQHDLT